MSSFGKDSMLLLWLVRQVRPDTPVIWLRTGQDERFAKGVIRTWGLTAFSWAPAAVYAVSGGPYRTLVHEYGLGESRFPVLIDLEGQGPCAAQRFAHRRPSLYLPFDTLLVGYKDTDTHWLKGDAKLFDEETQFGRARVVAPIRHMTDEQVRAALKDYAIPYQPVKDQLALCTHCVDTIPAAQFRSRFNLTEESNHG